MKKLKSKTAFSYSKLNSCSIEVFNGTQKFTTAMRQVPVLCLLSFTAIHFVEDLITFSLEERVLLTIKTPN